MSLATQNVSVQATTSVNQLMLNFLALVRIRNKRTAYLASAALEHLARLRVEAATAGFSQWDLMQKAPLAHENLALSYKRFMAVFEQLVEALREPTFPWSSMHSLSIQNAVTQVEAAWEALKESI